MRNNSAWLRLAVLAIAVVAASAAHAGDHAVCRQVQDPSTASMAIDIGTALFGNQQGCVLRGSARRICTPAAATVVGEAEAAVPGLDDSGTRACYRLECPANGTRRMQVSDRFGTRTVTVRDAKVLCIPAAQ